MTEQMRRIFGEKAIVMEQLEFGQKSRASGNIYCRILIAGVCTVLPEIL